MVLGAKLCNLAQGASWKGVTEQSAGLRSSQSIHPHPFSHTCPFHQSHPPPKTQKKASQLIRCNTFFHRLWAAIVDLSIRSDQPHPTFNSLSRGVSPKKTLLQLLGLHMDHLAVVLNDQLAILPFRLLDQSLASQQQGIVHLLLHLLNIFLTHN